MTNGLVERFMRFVSMEPMSGCWLWTGQHATNGYGRFEVARRTLATHRLSWEMHHGAIPEKTCACHHCDNRICVNPSHLFLGSKGDNNRDMMNKGRDRHRFGVTHGMSKINDDIVREIRARRASGETQRVVALCYGISQANVSLIFARKTWAHV